MRIKKSFFTIFSAASILFFLMSISLAWAQDPCVKEGDTYKCINPIKAADVVALIDSVVTQVWPFLLAIATFIIIYSGFRLAVAAGTGNQAEISKWKNNITWVILGSAIIAGGVIIVQAVRKFAEGLS